jgi:dihydrofolate synthase/folylpolyglutamate synthase
LLAKHLPVNQQAIRQALMNVDLPGRFQVIPGEPVCIFDVAHNTDALRQLSRQLQAFSCKGKMLAVLGMLADKDIESALMEIQGGIDEWFLAPLLTPRAASAQDLENVLQSQDSTVISHTCDSVTEALKAAKQKANKDDCIVIFGSFYTVAEAMPQTL